MSLRTSLDLQTPLRNYSGARLIETLNAAIDGARETTIVVAGDAFHDKTYDADDWRSGMGRGAFTTRRLGGAGAVAASVFNLTAVHGRNPLLKSRYLFVGKRVFAWSPGGRTAYAFREVHSGHGEEFHRVVRTEIGSDRSRPLAFAWCDHGYCVEEPRPETRDLLRRLAVRSGHTVTLVDAKPSGRGGYPYGRFDLVKGTAAEVDAVPFEDRNPSGEFVKTYGASGLATGMPICASPIVREVDPNGCGDSVFAVLTLVLAARASAGLPPVPDDAELALAAAAGAWQASQYGNATLTRPVFLSWLASPPEAVVFVNGAFDGLHEGHQALLLRAASAGGAFQRVKVVVGVNSDAYIHHVKKATPIDKFSIRANKVAGFLADRNVAFDVRDIGFNPRELLREVRPHAVVKTYGQELLESDLYHELGVRVLLAPKIDGVSSTQLRKELNVGTEEARRDEA